jgi:hypothetical protein
MAVIISADGERVINADNITVMYIDAEKGVYNIEAEVVYSDEPILIMTCDSATLAKERLSQLAMAIAWKPTPEEHTRAITIRDDGVYH